MQVLSGADLGDPAFAYPPMSVRKEVKTPQRHDSVDSKFRNVGYQILETV